MGSPLLPLLAFLVSPLLGASVPATVPRTEFTIVVGGSLLSAHQDVASGSRPLPVVFAPFLPALPFEAAVETRLGGSILQGLQVAHRFGDRAWLEWAFAIAPSHERRRRLTLTTNAGEFPLALVGLLPPFEDEENLLSYRWSVGAAWDLARGRTRPFVSGGIGAVTYDADEWETDLAIRLGGGVRRYFGRLSVRLEVADHWIPEHFLTDGSEHDVVVQAGFGYGIH